MCLELISCFSAVYRALDTELKAVSGNVGKNVSAGQNRKIVWKPLEENETFIAENVRFKVEALSRTLIQGMQLCPAPIFRERSKPSLSSSKNQKVKIKSSVLD